MIRTLVTPHRLETFAHGGASLLCRAGDGDDFELPLADGAVEAQALLLSGAQLALTLSRADGFAPVNDVLPPDLQRKIDEAQATIVAKDEKIATLQASLAERTTEQDGEHTVTVGLRAKIKELEDGAAACDMARIGCGDLGYGEIDIRQAIVDLRCRVGGWVVSTFSEAALADRKERAARMVEEAIELAQAEGLWLDETSTIMTRVYSRPTGETKQELGGLMVTTLALCAGLKIDLIAVTIDEIERIEKPEVIAKIRAKQAEKALAGTGKNYATECVPECAYEGKGHARCIQKEPPRDLASPESLPEKEKTDEARLDNNSAGVADESVIAKGTPSVIEESVAPASRHPSADSAAAPAVDSAECVQSTDQEGRSSAPAGLEGPALYLVTADGADASDDAGRIGRPRDTTCWAPGCSDEDTAKVRSAHGGTVAKGRYCKPHATWSAEQLRAWDHARDERKRREAKARAEAKKNAGVTQ